MVQYTRPRDSNDVKLKCSNSGNRDFLWTVITATTDCNIAAARQVLYAGSVPRLYITTINGTSQSVQRVSRRQSWSSRVRARRQAIREGPGLRQLLEEAWEAEEPPLLKVVVQQCPFSCETGASLRRSESGSRGASTVGTRYLAVQ